MSQRGIGAPRHARPAVAAACAAAAARPLINMAPAQWCRLGLSFMLGKPRDCAGRGTCGDYMPKAAACQYCHVSLHVLRVPITTACSSGLRMWTCRPAVRTSFLAASHLDSFVRQRSDQTSWLSVRTFSSVFRCLSVRMQLIPRGHANVPALMRTRLAMHILAGEFAGAQPHHTCISNVAGRVVQEVSVVTKPCSVHQLQQHHQRSRFENCVEQYAGHRESCCREQWLMYTSGSGSENSQQGGSRIRRPAQSG